MNTNNCIPSQLLSTEGVLFVPEAGYEAIHQLLNTMEVRLFPIDIPNLMPEKKMCNITSYHFYPLILSFFFIIVHYL